MQKCIFLYFFLKGTELLKWLLEYVKFLLNITVYMLELQLIFFVLIFMMQLKQHCSIQPQQYNYNVFIYEEHNYESGKYLRLFLPDRYFINYPKKSQLRKANSPFLWLLFQLNRCALARRFGIHKYNLSRTGIWILITYSTDWILFPSKLKYLRLLNLMCEIDFMMLGYLLETKSQINNGDKVGLYAILLSIHRLMPLKVSAICYLLGIFTCTYLYIVSPKNFWYISLLWCINELYIIDMLHFYYKSWKSFFYVRNVKREKTWIHLFIL